MIPKYIFAALGTMVTLVLSAQGVSSQAPSSMISRRASSTGSYPFYIGVGASKITYGITELERITSTDPLIGKFERAGKPFCAWGMHFKAGVIFSNGKRHPILGRLKMNNLLVEVDVQNHVRNMKERTTGTLLLHVVQGSLRLGFRQNLFYPFVCQWTFGPILYQSTDMFLNITGEKNAGSTIRVPQTSFIKGLEYRFRFSLIDPAGTGGGWGFYVEFQWSDLFQKSITALEPLYTAVGRTGYFGRPDMDHGVVNFGFVVPLALPFR